MIDIQPIIRRGDIWACVHHLMRNMYAESGYTDIPYSDSRVNFVLAQCVDMGFARIAFVAHRPVGFLLGEIVQYTFSEYKIAQDVAFYVEADMRSIGIGGELLQAFAQWACQPNVKEVQVGLTYQNDSDPLPAEKLLRKHGFFPVGKVFKLKRY